MFAKRIATALVWLSFAAHAEESPAPVAAVPAAAPVAAPADAGEDVDVDAIKKKYWATGDTAEMGVVQNRLYSKAGKFDLGIAGGVAFSDPFLSLRPVDVSFGYHFNEFIGVNAMYGKVYSDPSNALKTLHESQKEANTVAPQSLYAGEVTGSFLYGKLSLMGESIIYYDMYLSGGGGLVKTENGNASAYMGGVGQRYYITNWLSLKLDYRLLSYTEKIVEKEITSRLGQVVGSRHNFTHTILIGLNAMFGVF